MARCIPKLASPSEIKLDKRPFEGGERLIQAISEWTELSALRLVGVSVSDERIWLRLQQTCPLIR
ncbi:hypothetical protein BCY86_02800 [Pajaroellobacter abortibovis]|uniref:Uncharacterized protein n=1 Tax=Pajaroellobacter abortibovis TaxID=1882918 RepID=A0A1L6MVZ9_9BACT|nr:hypothetical protein BCY86_02800 [Pajaroellobacter abortibovis]